MTIGAAQQFFLGASKATGGGAAGYQIERSLRFNSSDSGYCSRTPAVAGNRTTWTWAGWVKRSNLGTAYRNILSAANSSNDRYEFYFTPSDELSGEIRIGGTGYAITTTPIYRDPSAWYHLVVVMDTTQATAADRHKIYINGTQVTSFSSASYPPQNSTPQFNAADPHSIGRYQNGASQYFDGYLADIHFIDGQALTPSSFTVTDGATGQLVPKEYTGTYGTNGFNLLFADNSNNTAATLGKDTSPNGNNWTPNNLSVTTTSTTYTPVSNTNLQMTWADLLVPGNQSGMYSYDNTVATGTFAVTKAYSSLVEVLVCSTNGSAPVYVNGVSVASLPTGNNISNAAWRTALTGSGTLTSVAVQSDGPQRGIIFQVRVDGVQLVNITPADNDSLVDTPTSYGTDTGVGGSVRGNYCTMNPLLTTGSACTFSNGNLETAVSSVGSQRAWGTFGVSSGKWYFEYTQTSGSYAQGIGIKSTFNSDNNNNYVYTGYDGTKVNASGSATSYGATWGINDVIGVAFDLDNATITFYKNGASQGTAFTGIDSGTYFPWFLGWSGGSGVNFTMNFGQRAFAYTAPSGFKALCDTNLGAPLVAKPNTLFDVVKYDGTGAAQTITGLAFNPDFVWLKRRSSAQAHYLYDVIRGTSSVLFSDGTDAEQSISTGLTAFNSDGFSLGSLSGVNASSTTNVAWTWDAGTSTVSNTAGSITNAQVRANATAGFSVVTYTGTGANATVGHGLGVAPGFIIIKNRSSATNWRVYHSALGNTKAIFLSTTGASDTSSVYWNNTSPTSTVFSVGSDDGANGNTNLMVAYCFTPVVGYSNGFSYTGNGSADGSFVYLGFRPRLIMLKRSDSTSNWTLLDTSREGYNVDNDPLYPNLSDAEGTTDLLDITSNGFKLRSTDASVNASAGTYIGFAWAEAPFAYSRAR